MQVIENQSCHGRHVSLNHPQGSKFCKVCNDYVLVDAWHKCTCCLNKVSRESKMAKTYRRFEDIVEQNQSIINCYLKTPYKCNNLPGFVIWIDWRTYLVSIEDVAEFAKLRITGDHDILKSLVQKIQAKAALVYPGTKIR